MKIIFAILTILLAFALSTWGQSVVVGDNNVSAVGSAESAGPPDTQFQLPEDAATAAQAGNPIDGADLLLKRIVATLYQSQSVAARIRYQVDLFGQHSLGEGLYLQQGTGDQRQFRLDLKTNIDQKTLRFVQVCDGKFLWQFEDSPDSEKKSPSEKPTVNRLDVRRAQQAVLQTAAQRMTDPASELALGGLPKLLAGLQKSFRFTRAEAGQLDVLPVWIVSGVWRPEALVSVSKDLAHQAALGEPLNLKKLPAQLPEEVALYVGQDDLFPYRIEYRRRADKKGRAGDPGQDTMQTILVVEFFDARLNAPIDPQQFVYQPANVTVLDTTSSFIMAIEKKPENNKRPATSD
jgi:hypothetical protein